MRPSFMRFFCFMRRFWNQILTWVSLSCSAVAISMRRARVRYLLKWNSFSSSVSCLVVKLVRPVPLGPPWLAPLVKP
uniref:Putative secreted protein n=1 Tax=Ixodes ricinus TaxID=34613 RepID=A0A6B0UBN0_IXORI